MTKLTTKPKPTRRRAAIPRRGEGAKSLQILLVTLSERKSLMAVESYHEAASLWVWLADLVLTDLVMQLPLEVCLQAQVAEALWRARMHELDPKNWSDVLVDENGRPAMKGGAR